MRGTQILTISYLQFGWKRWTECFDTLTEAAAAMRLQESQRNSSSDHSETDKTRQFGGAVVQCRLAWNRQIEEVGEQTAVADGTLGPNRAPYTVSTHCVPHCPQLCAATFVQPQLCGTFV